MIKENKISSKIAEDTGHGGHLTAVSKERYTKFIFEKGQG